MTKKDYFIIAKVFQNHLHQFTDYEANIGLGEIVRELAEKMALDNPRFDRQRFLIACGYNS